MRIALLGTRGIPARYGGFETFAEEISARLTARGASLLTRAEQAVHTAEETFLARLSSRRQTEFKRALATLAAPETKPNLP